VHTRGFTHKHLNRLYTLASDKHLSLFVLSVGDEENVYNVDTCVTGLGVDVAAGDDRFEEDDDDTGLVPLGTATTLGAEVTRGGLGVWPA
jgi:hypothetical protein